MLVQDSLSVHVGDDDIDDVSGILLPSVSVVVVSNVLAVNSKS